MDTLSGEVTLLNSLPIFWKGVYSNVPNLIVASVESVVKCFLEAAKLRYGTEY